MKIETYIDALVSYAMNTGLAEPEDHIVLVNRLIDLLGKPDYEPSDEPQSEDLEEILAGMLDHAVEKGLCDDGITARDIFDTRIMGAVTPMPREVIRTFREKYAQDPVAATDWYYKFSCDTDYIRRYRIKKDMRWKYASQYGELDITINLSKPEKDPKAIAAAKNAPQTAYPKCQLCRENEGYAGRMNHPARQNHRIIPITMQEKPVAPVPVEARAITETIEIVEDDAEIEETMIMSDEDMGEVVEIQNIENVVVEEPEKEEEIFQVVENQPEFPGGMQALMKYLRDNIKYPSISRQNNSQGRAYINFVVNTDGSITDVEVMKSTNDVYLDKEAVRVVSGMPKWKPGKQQGKTVRVKYTLPVMFRLQ